MSGPTAQSNTTSSRLYPLPNTGSSVLSGLNRDTDQEANSSLNPDGINYIGLQGNQGARLYLEQRSLAELNVLQEQVQQMKERQTMLSNIMRVLHEIRMTIINALR